MDFPDEIERINHVYNTKYRPDPKDRSYPWNAFNPVSLYYRQSQERAFISLFNDFNIDLEPSEVLDVGCGTGGFLHFLASLGADPKKLHGIDLMEYRIDMARLLNPTAMDYLVGNAEDIPFPDQNFDLVSQLTVFSSIFDSGLHHKIAKEINRVLKPGGFMLWYDLRIGRSENTHGIERKEVLNLFPNYTARSITTLHPVRAASLAKRSVLLADIVGQIPWMKKTHILCLLIKPTR